MADYLCPFSKWSFTIPVCLLIVSAQHHPFPSPY